MNLKVVIMHLITSSSIIIDALRLASRLGPINKLTAVRRYFFLNQRALLGAIAASTHSQRPLATFWRAQRPR